MDCALCRLCRASCTDHDVQPTRRRWIVRHAPGVAPHRPQDLCPVQMHAVRRSGAHSTERAEVAEAAHFHVLLVEEEALFGSAEEPLVLQCPSLR